jgi:hypothetical protein
MKSETKICQNCKKEFEVFPEDFEFYEKIKIAPPELCFPCRLQNRLAFWAIGKFHKRKCDFSGEKIISIFPPNTRFPIYKTNYWYSDQWGSPSLVYDPERPFFDQLYELQNKVPRPHQFGTNNQNCDYCDDVWNSKNCYLCRSLVDCQNANYSYRIIRCRDSYDLLYCYDMEQSYDCIYCFKGFNIKYAFDTRDSLDSAFLYDCRNVENCFMCWNLRNKKYHILNKPYSKEEYFEKLKEYNLGLWGVVQKLKEEFENLIKEQAIHKINHNVKSVRSTGDYLTECKNCRESYFFETSEDCAYIWRGVGDKDVFDSNGVWKGELIYDVCQLTEGYNLKHCSYCTNCRNSEYLDFCVNCEDCFGCTGLKNKRFCILNKQYSEEEYQSLVSQIKDSMKKDGSYGKFFPYKMAYGGYNFSFANIIYPQTKEEIVRKDGVWEEMEKPDVSELEVEQFKEKIEEVSENIVGKAFVCEESGRAFNITKDEFLFYKHHNVPLPRHYPDIRTTKRMKKLFNFTPHDIKCFFCSKSVLSYYPLEWDYKKIACEECYLKEVV